MKKPDGSARRELPLTMFTELITKFTSDAGLPALRGATRSLLVQRDEESGEISVMVEPPSDAHRGMLARVCHVPYCREKTPAFIRFWEYRELQPVCGVCYRAITDEGGWDALWAHARSTSYAQFPELFEGVIFIPALLATTRTVKRIINQGDDLELPEVATFELIESAFAAFGKGYNEGRGHTTPEEFRARASSDALEGRLGPAHRLSDTVTEEQFRVAHRRICDLAEYVLVMQSKEIPPRLRGLFTDATGTHVHSLTYSEKIQKSAFQYGWVAGRKAFEEVAVETGCYAAYSPSSRPTTPPPSDA